MVDCQAGSSYPLPPISMLMLRLYTSSFFLRILSPAPQHWNWGSGSSTLDTRVDDALFFSIESFCVWKINGHEKSGLNYTAYRLIVFHFAIFASPRSLFRSRQFGQRVVVIDGMPFISKHPCRGPVLMIDGMSVWSKHHCRAHVVVIDGMSFWSKHPCRAHVVVFDGMCFSSMQPCRAHVVVDDGMSFSSMHPCRARVVVDDGMSFWSMHPCQACSANDQKTSQTQKITHRI